jgi:hypothetical protein
MLQVSYPVQIDLEGRAGHGDLCAFKHFGPYLPDKTQFNAFGNNPAAAALDEESMFRWIQFIFEAEK